MGVVLDDAGDLARLQRARLGSVGEAGGDEGLGLGA